MRKRRVESCLSLDVRELRRKGALAPAATGTLTWDRDGDAVAPVGFRIDTAGLVLAYDAYEGDSQRAIEQRVLLSSVPVALGGERTYFVCPGAECRRRVAMLYFMRGAFRCRRCHGLAYECQREDATQRARRRANKHRARLGWPEWRMLAQRLAARPKRRWRTTFRQQLKSIIAADAKADAAYAAQYWRLACRVERRAARAGTRIRG
ncbi:MAG: hypothetical protein ACRECV_18185 [Xanthobacteraceae bacterium]